MVDNDLHSFFLTHQDAKTLVFSVAQDSDFSDTALSPGFVAAALIK
jgi:hypothetical protein